MYAHIRAYTRVCNLVRYAERSVYAHTRVYGRTKIIWELVVWGGGWVWGLVGRGDWLGLEIGWSGRLWLIDQNHVLPKFFDFLSKKIPPRTY